MSFLVLKNLRKTFEKSVAVENFELEVAKGEMVTFLGSSGCGKSTTLRMVAGFEQPDSGRIVLDGRDITNLPANKRKIGMVFQSYALFPNMTVNQNIGFGLKLAKYPADRIQKRVSEMLELIQLPELGQRYPNQISGGQAQRVALARALAPQPELLLLDEPLSALDALIRRSLRTEIRRIQKQLGITTIYVTHDQEEALSLSDRLVVMSKGKIEQIGTPFEIYNYPATRFVAGFVGTLNILPARVIDAVRGEISLGEQPVKVDPALLSGLTPTTGQSNQITLALRPEDLSLDDGHANGLNHLKATVTEVAFLGAVIRTRVMLPGDLSLEIDLFNSRHLNLPQPGAAVNVAFSSDVGLVLAGTPVQSASLISSGLPSA